jgi:hypothetical protein
MNVSPAHLPSVLLLGATLAVTPVQQAHCEWPSPVGTLWDAVVTGSGQRGIAFLTFAEGGDLSGYQLLAPLPSTKPSYDPRTPFGDVGRQTVTGGGGTNKTYLYGISPVEGSWGFDEKGRLIGGYVLRQAGYETNTSLQTGVSFAGKVVPGKRLTLVAYTPMGKWNFSAISYRTMPDLSGNWYVTRKYSGQTFYESMPLTRDFGDLAEQFPDLATYPGIYYTGNADSDNYGRGPGYGFGGFTLLSSQKKIGYSFNSWTLGSSNSVVTVSTNYTPEGLPILVTNVTFNNDLPSYATLGSFTPSKKGNHKTATSGILGESDKVTLNAVWLSPLAPPPPAP